MNPSKVDEAAAPMQCNARSARPSSLVVSSDRQRSFHLAWCVTSARIEMTDDGLACRRHRFTAAVALDVVLRRDDGPDVRNVAGSSAAIVCGPKLQPLRQVRDRQTRVQQVKGETPSFKTSLIVCLFFFTSRIPLPGVRWNG